MRKVAKILAKSSTSSRRTAVDKAAPKRRRMSEASDIHMLNFPARKVPLVPAFFAGFGEDLSLFQPDRIHPTAAAQPRLLANVWPALAPLLRSR